MINLQLKGVPGVHGDTRGAPGYKLWWSGQQADGSGESDQDSGRPNKYRHALFTATTALRTWAAAPGE